MDRATRVLWWGAGIAIVLIVAVILSNQLGMSNFLDWVWKGLVLLLLADISAKLKK